MTDQTFRDVQTETDFEASLRRVIEGALENDVHISGGWMVEEPRTGREFGIEIYPVERDVD